MNYREKLQNLNWIRRRLQILVRDAFKCQKCGNKSINNHVHHVVYEKNREPWDYDDEYLITLCPKCHKIEHIEAKQIDDSIKKMKLSGMLSCDIKNKIDINFNNL